MPRRRTAWSLIAAFWALVAVMMGVQTWVVMWAHEHSLIRLVVYYLAVWSGWVLLTPLVFWLSRRFPLMPNIELRSVLVHSMAGLSIGVMHVAVWIALTIIIRPYDHMGITEFGPNFIHAAFARMPLEIVLYAAHLAAAYASHYYERSAQLEGSLVEARLHALELQIQPHFLFNTLNAVSSLVRGRKNTEAVEVIAGLSDLLRYSLDHAGEQRVPLAEEADTLRRYLAIQQVRFSDRLDVQINIDEDTRRARVPVLLLQPLAENAVRHGIASSAAAGRIELCARRENDRLLIELFNSGTLNEQAPRGIGLRNTEERLRQLYGSSHQFDLRRANGGVLATISLPWSVA